MTHVTAADTISMDDGGFRCVCGCYRRLNLKPGQIGFFATKECRKRGRQNGVHEQINREIRKERPWYFWLKLWCKRMLGIVVGYIKKYL